MTDERLMRDFQQGDMTAFQALFEKYRDRIFRFIYAAYEKNASIVEELTQEVFIKVIRSKHSYAPEKPFSSWLYAIARNHCLNKLSSPARRYEMITYERQDFDQPTERTGATELEREELAALIREKVAELPEIQRVIFVTREMDGLSYKAIARALGVTQENARARYHRAKKTLRTWLKPYLEDEQ